MIWGDSAAEYCLRFHSLGLALSWPVCPAHRPTRAVWGCLCRQRLYFGGAGAAHASLPTRLQAQRWRNENYERPVDLEGSGDDDPFGDDELDDVYSGSGSGCK